MTRPLTRFLLVFIRSASLSSYPKKHRCIYISRLGFVLHCLVSTFEAPKNLYFQTCVVFSDEDQNRFLPALNLGMSLKW